jgi:putative Mn2+ efflux pump MntP
MRDLFGLEAPVVWQIGVAILFLIGAWLIVFAVVGDDDEEEEHRKEQIQNRFSRYDQAKDPLLKDHAATSLVIRSSSRGEKTRGH